MAITKKQAEKAKEEQQPPADQQQPPADQQQPPADDSGLVKVNLKREFKFWDGQQVNVYQPGENEVTAECAKWAADAGAIVETKSKD